VCALAFIFMARRSTSYLVELTPNRRAHAMPAERWKAYVAAGLLVVSNSDKRVARLRDSQVKALPLAGELYLVDVGARVRTNAEVIDRLWVLADAGAVSRSAAEQRAILAIRSAFGEDVQQREKFDRPDTRAAVSDYMADQRTRRIQDELIRAQRTQIVMGRALLGARGDLLDRLEAA
jgi:hypothetical protein